jgi:hypothetical protein
MNCNCTNTLKIPTCANKLIIGQAEENTIYNIHINNKSTNYNSIQQFETDNTGIVELDLTNPSKDFYNQSSLYEIFITLEGTSVPSNIKIGSIEYSCFNIEFEKINSDININEWTLELL